MLMRNKVFTVDVRIWDGAEDSCIVGWLGSRFVGVEPGGEQPRLMFTDKDGRVFSAGPGDHIAQWAEGSITVSSPAAAALIFRPVEE